MKSSWLVSWIGNTDLRCSLGEEGDRLGPVASALAARRFDRVWLLTSYAHDKSDAYCRWLEKKTVCAPELIEVGLANPTDYAEIYQKVSHELQILKLPNEAIQLTFHLSPGTPAMAAIWIMLAKTRFPASLIQTSIESGLQDVNFPFNLAADFLPEYLQASDNSMRRLAEQAHFQRIVYQSDTMHRQVLLAQKMALFDVPVLILGESGTGKELFADAMHRASRRADKPMIAVNCGAIPKELANAELFGHKKGAFTGADVERKGHFREADGGTLFLDEIGELPADTQVKLLRVLQTGEVTPVGQSTPVKVNVRIFAATHRDLQADVEAGMFREDLFHRLAVGLLDLPPLRDRDADISLLIDHFLDVINQEMAAQPGNQHKNISVEARKLLSRQPWPGNVRQLYHTLVRAAIWADHETLDEADIQAALLRRASKTDGILGRDVSQGIDINEVLSEVARHYLPRALAITAGNKTRAAELLGLSNYQTLNNWLQRYGIENEE